MSFFLCSVSTVYYIDFFLHWTILAFWEQIPWSWCIIQYAAELCLPLFCWGFCISVQMVCCFLVCVYLISVSGNCWLHRVSQEAFLPVEVVWKVWRILVWGRIHQWNHLTLAFSFLGRFFIVDSASYQLRSIQVFFSYLNPSFGTLYISRNLLFHLDYLLVYNFIV